MHWTGTKEEGNKGVNLGLCFWPRGEWGSSAGVSLLPKCPPALSSHNNSSSFSHWQMQITALEMAGSICSCQWQWFHRQLVRFGTPAASAKSQLLPLLSHRYSEITSLCFSAGVWQAILLPSYPTSSTVFLSMYLIFLYTTLHPKISPVLQGAGKHTHTAIYIPWGRTKVQLFPEQGPSSTLADIPDSQSLWC